MLLILIGLAAIGRYVIRLGRPFLATGMLGLTLGVTEWVFDRTGGQLGMAGALLVGGAILLATAVAGPRLRRGAAAPKRVDRAGGDQTVAGE